jgi:selenocysteine lyase/cysteine desulfurase
VIDIDAVRADTPGCQRVTHLNNAGAALMPRPVVDAVVDHLRLEAEIGGYEAAAAARDRVEQVYAAVADLLGAQPHEIALLESATRAWDLAFYAFDLRPGDRILTATAEYASNVIAFLQVAQRTGATVEVIPDDEHGQLSVEALEAMVDDRTRLIAITHVPTHGGLVNPAAEVGAVARRAGVPFLLDACQSVGQMPIDVRQLGCDLLTATGRKYLRAPRGTGLLYVSEQLVGQLEPPMLDLHSASWPAADRFEIRGDARRFETWEASYALRLGLGVAVDYALGLGLEAIEARIVPLAERLRSDLAALPGVTVHDQGRRRCGIVTFSDERQPAEEVAGRLAEQRINVSVSPAEFARYDFEARGLPTLVRASVHYYNTEDELDLLVTALRR